MLYWLMVFAGLALLILVISSTPMPKRSKWGKRKAIAINIGDVFGRISDGGKCAKLRRELLRVLGDRGDTANRLIALEKRKNPGKPERWYLEKVLYDCKRRR